MPDAHELKITLIGSRPPIWRRVAVPSEITLSKLHIVIQVAMGWQESHLHDFRIGKMVYGEPEPGGFGGFMGEAHIVSEKKARIADVLPRKGSKGIYTYDFGDSWEHSVVVEKVGPAELGVDYPCCLGGARACPPEDCGGLPGFYNLLDALADPNHEEHESLTEWIGGDFHADEFSVEDVSHQLRRMFRPARKAAAKKAP